VGLTHSHLGFDTPRLLWPKRAGRFQLTNIRGTSRKTPIAADVLPAEDLRRFGVPKRLARGQAQRRVVGLMRHEPRARACYENPPLLD